MPCCYCTCFLLSNEDILEIQSSLSWLEIRNIQIQHRPLFRDDSEASESLVPLGNDFMSQQAGAPEPELWSFAMSASKLWGGDAGVGTPTSRTLENQTLVYSSLINLSSSLGALSHLSSSLLALVLCSLSYAWLLVVAKAGRDPGRPVVGNIEQCNTFVANSKG